MSFVDMIGIGSNPALSPTQRWHYWTAHPDGSSLRLDSFKTILIHVIRVPPKISISRVGAALALVLPLWNCFSIGRDLDCNLRIEVLRVTRRNKTNTGCTGLIKFGWNGKLRRATNGYEVTAIGYAGYRTWIRKRFFLMHTISLSPPVVGIPPDDVSPKTSRKPPGTRARLALLELNTRATPLSSSTYGIADEHGTLSSVQGGHAAFEVAPALFVSTTMVVDQCNILSNPDVSGVGVRAAIYTQNLTCFLPVIVHLWDRKISSGRFSTVKQWSFPCLGHQMAYFAVCNSMTGGSDGFGT
ncbi:hypothetical protein B0H14DRAFT_3140547 [Mycena olivaceomarginata]|nr:hypothetical protein B0H14DRAFT_3140547 [Mycena olivaceomarginata]